MTLTGARNWKCFRRHMALHGHGHGQQQDGVVEIILGGPFRSSP